MPTRCASTCCRRWHARAGRCRRRLLREDRLHPERETRRVRKPRVWTAGGEAFTCRPASPTRRRGSGSGVRRAIRRPSRIHRRGWRARHGAGRHGRWVLPPAAFTPCARRACRRSSHSAATTCPWPRAGDLNPGTSPILSPRAWLRIWPALVPAHARGKAAWRHAARGREPWASTTAARCRAGAAPTSWCGTSTARPSCATGSAARSRALSTPLAAACTRPEQPAAWRPPLPHGKKKPCQGGSFHDSVAARCGRGGGGPQAGRLLAGAFFAAAGVPFTAGLATVLVAATVWRNATRDAIAAGVALAFGGFLSPLAHGVTSIRDGYETAGQDSSAGGKAA